MIKKNKYLITMQHSGYFEKEIEASSIREARIIALNNLNLKDWKNLKKDHNKILFVEDKKIMDDIIDEAIKYDIKN
jgi:hypothetical protein